MAEKKSFYPFIFAAAAILVILSILAIVTKSFVADVILHSYFRVLCVVTIIKLLQKSFRDYLSKSKNTVLVLCSAVLILDLVIVEAIRFVLSNGVSTALFLPACLPLCFMIVMRGYAKDSGQDKAWQRIATYIVGIAVLSLSIYFEILSFVQI